MSKTWWTPASNAEKVPQHGKVEMFTGFSISLNWSEQHAQHHFPNTQHSAADNNQITQFSSAVGLGNKMRLKSRLLPFSLVPIRRQHVFWFHFCNLPPYSKCCCMLTCLQGHSKSHFLESCPLMTARKISLMSLPYCDTVYYGLKIIILQKSMSAEFYSQTRCFQL